MKISGAVFIVLMMFVPVTTYSYPNTLHHLLNIKVGYDVDPRFGQMNDGLTMMRFESQETHGYRKEHGYDREDVGMRYNNDRYGYTWDSTTDHWNERDW